MNQAKIVIVDYGVGNTFSIAEAVSRLGFSRIEITGDYDKILHANALILPGVGAFKSCSDRLAIGGFREILNEAVLAKKAPILGICVGMQLLATSSNEHGFHYGLNWIPGEVEKLVRFEDCIVPHVGWNDISLSRDNDLFNSMMRPANFYFDHSYHFLCDSKFVIATANYGSNFVAAVKSENIYGVQFHPEKSQRNGLKFLRNFFDEVL